MSKEKIFLSRELESRGASFSLECQAGRAELRVIGPAEHSTEILKLLFKCFADPRAPGQTLSLAKRKIAAELRYRSTSSRAMAEDAIRRLLYCDADPRHVEDTEARIRAIEMVDRTDIQNFPLFNEAHLVIAGNIDPTVAADILSEALPPSAPRSDRPIPTWPYPTTCPGSTRIEVPGAQHTVALGRPVRLNSAHPDYLTACLMNNVLGGAFNSWLVEATREEHGLNYSIQSELHCRDPKHTGHWLVHFSPNAGDLERATSIVRSVISRFSDSKISEADLDLQKNAYVGRFLVSLSSLSGLCALALSEAERGSGPDYMLSLPDRIRAITMEDVERVRSEHFQDRDFFTAVAGPNPKPVR
ncbi:M16 family metallopeptidase [Luteimonas sp. JM171]|uniref:M16 family metallopeptidase n=1 Tax=Luteimonas sp. JM171 TaxID=1896164 RepID=UPI0012F762AB|nr:insulinase family protein [Luteimonas sp. JM171]